MTPEDLELPPKFSKWRPKQLDAVLAAACADTRFVMLNMPTGTGKSATYIAASRLMSGRTAILTETKGLQLQLMDDFHSMGLREIKGQNNYPCIYFEDSGRRVTCDEGPCHAGVECTFKSFGCHYYDAVRTAARSSMLVTNYAYWMTMNCYSEPGTLGKFDTLILDEAHATADALADFVRITIDRNEVRKLLDIICPNNASIDEWVEWAIHPLKVCYGLIEGAKAQANLYHQGVTTVRRLTDLHTQLFQLARARTWKRTDAANPPVWMPGSTTDWVIEETQDKILFQPVWAKAYAEDYLFYRIPKVILVSATVTQRDAQYIGIPPNQLSYFEYPSPFKKERRPIFVVPTVRVGRNMVAGETRIWMSRIDQIVEKELESDGRVKGIIHAISYARAKEIFQSSKYRHLMMIHGSRDTRDTVDRFKRSSGPCILVSPSVGTGWDFPGDTCRFQIIAKIPFIDNRPAIIQARHKEDKKYLNHIAMVNLIQTYGRGVRSDDDWCRTYIIDDNWGDWFYPKNRKSVPLWFRAAVRKVSTIHDIKGGKLR